MVLDNGTRAWRRLRLACETAKRDLTTAEVANIYLPELTGPNEVSDGSPCRGACLLQPLACLLQPHAHRHALGYASEASVYPRDYLSAMLLSELCPLNID